MKQSPKSLLPIFFSISLMNPATLLAQTLETVTTTGNTSSNAIRVAGEANTGTSSNLELVLTGLYNTPKTSDTRCFIGVKSGTNTITDGLNSTLLLQARSYDPGGSDFPIDFATGQGTPQLRLRIKGNGNVGIGTGSPVAALHLHTATTSTVFRQSTSNTSYYSEITTNANSNDAFNIKLHDFYLMKATSDGYQLLELGNSSGLNINLLTSGLGKTTIPFGNVGIGTSAPSAKLQLIGNAIFGQNSNSSTNARLDITAGGSGYSSLIDFGYYNTFDASIWNIGRFADGSFRVSDYSSGSEVNRLLINTTGQMGIGTTTPATNYKVHIVPPATGEGLLIGNTAAGNTNLNFKISSASNGYASLQVVKSSPSTYGYLYLNPLGGVVGIGTSSLTSTSGNCKLLVEGNIGCRDLLVTLASPFPDYVFQEDYNLMKLEALNTYIKENKHLPNLPSSKQIEEEGGRKIAVGDMQIRLLEKIEELTLYVLELKKENDDIQQKLKAVVERQ